jgi:hypothetical protein
MNVPNDPSHNPPHALRYEGVHCTLHIECVAPQVIVMTIAGSDIGEFGDAPMLALQAWLQPGSEIELYIDARAARGATVDVSSEWGRWLARNKSALHRVTMLTGSRFVQITAEFVRRFADLGGIMRICTEAAVFDEALSEARRWR